MEVLFDFAMSVVSLFEALYIFFCLPLGDVPGALFAFFVQADDNFFTLFFDAFFGFLGDYAPWLLGVPLASILLGSGITVFLLWRVVKLVIPIFQ